MFRYTIHRYYLYYLENAAKLLDAFQHQLLMTQSLSTFHDAHDVSINSISSIFVDIFYHLLVLVHRGKRYLQSNECVNQRTKKTEKKELLLLEHSRGKSCPDLNPSHFVGEFGIELEDVVGRDGVCHWRFL